MKKIAIIFLVALIIFLQSCVLNESNGENHDDTLIWENLININENAGIVISSMAKTGDLTPFKTQEEVDSFNTFPCTFIDGDNIYVIRNFSKNLTEDIYAYIDKKIQIKEIEIYSVSNLFGEPAKIALKGIDEKHIIYYKLTYIKTDKIYYITGAEEIDGKFIPKLYKFDNKGQLQADLLLQNLNLDDIIVTSEYIYYLKGTVKDGVKSCDLIRYSLKDSTTSVIDGSVSVFFGNADMIYYIKNEITASFDAKTVLYEYDAEKDNKTSISEITTNLNILDACFDKTNGNLYISDTGNIYAYSIKDKTSVKVMEAMQTFMNILQISNANMLVSIGHNQIAVYELTTKPASIAENEKPLKICYVGSQDGQAALQYDYPLKNMKLNGTFVRLEDAYMTGNFNEYMNTMAKKLLSGDDDFDLFYVHTSMFELFKNQYYTNLSLFLELANRFDSMLPGVKELCSIDDKLCLVPLNINFHMIQCNDELTNGKYEIPETLDKMLSFKDKIVGSFSDSLSIFMSGYFNHSLVAPWFEQYAANFIAGSININDKNSLESLISTSLSLLQDDSVYIGTDKVDSYIKIIQNQGHDNGFENESLSLYPIPKVDDSFKYNAEGFFIAINPNSRNKQLTANFLAYVIDFNAYMGFPILYENTGDHNHNHEHNDNTEFFELSYKNLLKNSVRQYQNSEYMLLLADQFDQLFSEKISVEQMTEEIYKFLKMVRDE